MVLETSRLPLSYAPIGTGLRNRTASSAFTVQPLIAIEHTQRVWRRVRVSIPIVGLQRPKSLPKAPLLAQREGFDPSSSG